MLCNTRSRLLCFLSTFDSFKVSPTEASLIQQEEWKTRHARRAATQPGPGAGSRVETKCDNISDSRVADSRRQPSCLQAVVAVTSGLGSVRLFSDLAAALAQDRILLRGLVFHGYHGVYPEARRALGAWACSGQVMPSCHSGLQGASGCSPGGCCPPSPLQSRQHQPCLPLNTLPAPGEQVGTEVCRGCHAVHRPGPCRAQRRPGPHHQLCAGLRVSAGRAAGAGCAYPLSRRRRRGTAWRHATRGDAALPRGNAHAAPKASLAPPHTFAKAALPAVAALQSHGGSRCLLLPMPAGTSRV